jgi:DNA repair protein RadA/Sms
MAKTKTVTTFICQQCGNTQPKWMGKCPDCGAWNSLVEFAEPRAGAAPARARMAGVPLSQPQALGEITGEALARLPLPMEEFSRVLGGGLVKGSLVLVGGDPGVGKCVTGDTRVLDADTGDYLPITEWAFRHYTVIGLDEQTLRLKIAPVNAFLTQGVHPVVRVKTKSGCELRCTPSHPVLTVNGWRAVGELSAGERIAAPRSLPVFGKEPMPEAEIKLVAHLLSEGSAQSAVAITTSLPEVVADLEEIADHFKVGLVRYRKANTRAQQYRFANSRRSKAIARQKLAAALRAAREEANLSWAEWSRRAGVNGQMLNAWSRGDCVPAPEQLASLAAAIGRAPDMLASEARDRAAAVGSVMRFVERHGLRYARAADKFVPDCIFRLPREQLALFLRALFSGDGSVFVNRSGACGFSYSTISRRLAEDVRHLLLRFGINAKLRTKPSKVANRPYLAYEVAGVGAKRTQAFLSEIGIYGRDAAVAALLEHAPTFESTHTDVVPTGPAFWALLGEVTAPATFREISRRTGVKLANRRHERPLRRSTVARLAEAYPHPRLEALGKGDVGWDEIVSIEADGEAEVFDLSVPGIANFVANDLFLHNSTLLTVVAAQVAERYGTVLYVSGEESVRQIKMRADRMDLGAPEGAAARDANLFLVTETNLNTIFEHVEKLQPQLLVVDSIQTVYLDELTSTAGSITQVRECAARLQLLAKSAGVAIFLVGHVTKEGSIAGPKVLEHIVDTVLYLEGDRYHTYRLLRSVKNRFGPTSEVGVFEMRGTGMVEVANPSEAFLAERLINAPGSAIAVTMEGTRPILVEVQALATPTSFPNPRRTPNGIDFNRLLLITAVLGKRAGLRLAEQDVFVNVVGGLAVEEPAVDLAVAVAIASSTRDRPVVADMAFVGELGLNGELRAVGQLGARLREAAKLGFRRCLVPRTMRKPAEGYPAGLEVIGVRSIGEALQVALLPKQEG